MTIQLNEQQLGSFQLAFLNEYTKAKANVLYVNKTMLKECIKSAVDAFNKLDEKAAVEKVAAKTAKPKKEKKEKK